MNTTDNPAPIELAVPSLSSRIVKLAKKVQSARDAFLASKNLAPGHDDFLIAIGSADGVTMGALAETLDITPSSTTKIAIKMEAAQLLRREPSRIDSRQNHALLTEQGAALVDEIIAHYKQLDEKLIKSAKTKEIERAFKLFDRIETDPSSEAKKPKKAGKKKAKDSSSKKSSKKNKKKG